MTHFNKKKSFLVHLFLLLYCNEIHNLNGRIIHMLRTFLSFCLARKNMILNIRDACMYLYTVVWISRAVPRHSFYTWLVIQNRNPTRDMLLQWGIQVDDCCLLCNSHQESRDYLYFSCNFSFDLWGKVARTLQLTPHRSWQAKWLLSFHHYRKGFSPFLHGNQPCSGFGEK